MKYLDRTIHNILFAVIICISISLKAEENGLYDSYVFRNFENQDITLEQFQRKDKLVLVHLWATWCPPCREEMPDILALARMLRRNLTIIVTAVDESKEVQEDFLNQVFLEYGNPSENVYFGSVSEETVDEIFDYSALPSSFLFDRNGNLVLDIVGSRPWTGNKKEWEYEWVPNWWPFSWPERKPDIAWEDYIMNFYHSSGE